MDGCLKNVVITIITYVNERDGGKTSTIAVDLLVTGYFPVLTLVW